jgi:Fic family protein
MSQEIKSNILKILETQEYLTTSGFLEIYRNSSLATIKRSFKELLDQGLIVREGLGKATGYKLSRSYQIIRPIDLDEYFKKEIDERDINAHFNMELINSFLNDLPLFSPLEMEKLDSLQANYKANVSNLSPSEFSKELERLAIDLSWKSSQIEGNTYSLLETEILLKEKSESKGKTKEEAIMLLNHKSALDFLIENHDYIEPLTLSAIENIHVLLTKELNINKNLRRVRVGISGTNYQPLDNEFAIKEAMLNTCELINSKKNPFEKAFLCLILISYIQPFADGNKRTARIVSNSILFHFQYCPISFRTADPLEYKKAMLLFYEQNNISAFKKIFIEQFEFATKTYF